MLEEVHVPFVSELSVRGDWSGLVRYWIAHDLHRPALDAAVEIVRQRGDAIAGPLAGYLLAVAADPFGADFPAELGAMEWEEPEQLTLALLERFGGFLFCEMADQAGNDQRWQLYELGITTAREFVTVAQRLNDAPLEAVAHGMIASAQSDLRQLEGAEQSYRESLEVYRRLASSSPQSRAVYEPYVAGTLNNLGLLQRALRQLEGAEQSYREALEIRRRLASSSPQSRAVYEPYIAGTLNNLGNVQRDLRQLEGAEQSFREALEVYRRLASSSPQSRAVYEPDVAMTLNNLGNVQRDRRQLEGAEQSYREALEIRRRLASSSPQSRAVYEPDVALTLNNLGNVQRDLRQLEGAEQSYRESLEIRRRLASSSPQSRAVYEPDVAMTLNNLGTVQSALRQLEGAEQSYREALEIRRRLASSSPQSRAVYEPDVAMTLNNLGTVQRDRRQREGAEQSYREALEVYRRLASSSPQSRAVYEPDVALTLNNLGNVQRDRRQREGAEQSFREALEVYRRLASSSPQSRAVYEPDVAMTLNNLGNVQRDRRQLEGAEQSYREALEIRRRLASSSPQSRAVYEPDVALTLNNLGNVQRDLRQLEGAEQSYREAETIYERLAEMLGTSQLEERLRCYRNHGNLLLQDEPALGWPDRHRARDLLETAAGFAELIRGLFVNPAERIRIQDEMSSLYATLVQLNLEIGHLLGDADAFTKAVEWAEASRSRVLLESLAEEELDLNRAPFELREEFRTLRRKLRRSLRRMQQELEVNIALQRLVENEDEPEGEDAENRIDPDDAPGPLRGGEPAELVESGPRLRQVRMPELVADLHQFEARGEQLAHLQQQIETLAPQYQELEERMVREVPGFDPNPPVEPFRVSRLSALLPSDRRTVYVHLHWLGDHAHAVLMGTNGCQPLKLELLTRETLNQALQRLASAQFGGVARDQIEVAMIAETQMVTDQLRTQLIEPLLPILEAWQAERVVFVPEGAMNFLPLHAAPLSDGQLFGDRYEVSYTPSLSILERCAQRTRPQPKNYFHAVNPLEDLPFANLESRLIEGRFPVRQILEPEQVTRAAFLQGVSRSHVCSWSGHAQFIWQVPLWSGLVLRQGQEHFNPEDSLTLIDADHGLALPDCSLAVLAGCQSGLALPGSGNEYISLVGAFLNAGAQCVLASLWPVDDFASMLTVDDFFARWNGGELSPAAALQGTQQWLRSLTVAQLQQHVKENLLPRVPENSHPLLTRTVNRYAKLGENHQPLASPFFWAPFVTVGLAFPMDSRISSES